MQDWRKTTWIAPEDAHKAPGTKYRTLLTDDDFADMPPYTGIKFRPKNGEMNDYTIGAAVDYPLMRIEGNVFNRSRSNRNEPRISSRYF